MDTEITNTGTSENMVTSTNANEAVLSCPFYGCKRLYSDMGTLSNHIREHQIPTQSLTGKVFLCSTIGCNGSFPSMQHLMEHMRHHHKPNNYFLCESCRAKLRSYRALLKHLHTCAKVAKSKAAKAVDLTELKPENEQEHMEAEPSQHVTFSCHQTPGDSLVPLSGSFKGSEPIGVLTQIQPEIGYSPFSPYVPPALPPNISEPQERICRPPTQSVSSPTRCQLSPAPLQPSPTQSQPSPDPVLPSPTQSQPSTSWAMPSSFWALPIPAQAALESEAVWRKN